MLTPSQRVRGFSLIEALVALVIMALLMAAAAPNFSDWIAGTRIRSTAESMLAGLQYAKNEATTRNVRVRFQLTTSVDASCALSVNGTNWVVDVVDAVNDSVASNCHRAPSDTVAPSILQVRSASEGSRGVRVNGGTSAVVFNGLGQQVVVGGGAAAWVDIDITPTNAAQCVANGGKITCLRVRVSPAGLIRMCNPTIADGDPQAC